ncbi:MAG: hypothetical protein JSW46_19585 [Gemmatimonadota bacterium]|nr:MAG: hypothetical protein JSW46_19585 [Gemmatimonadota bacterium]
MNCIDTTALIGVRAADRIWPERKDVHRRSRLIRALLSAAGRALADAWRLPYFAAFARMEALRGRPEHSGGGDAAAGGEGLRAAAATQGTESGRRSRAGSASRVGPAADVPTSEFAELVREAGAIAARYWDELSRRRAFTRPPEALVDCIRSEPLPRRPGQLTGILERIEREVVPFPNGPGHPRWWGFVCSPPHPAGIAAELISATLNNYVHGTSQIAVDVELKVLEWLAEMIGLPQTSSGVLVSGGSAANLVALAAAREASAPGTRARGVAALARPRTVYASTQIHSCIGRALETLGLGKDALRIIPVDADWRTDVDELRGVVRRDIEAGVEPMAIVGSAGTVNTGAVDRLDALADVAEEVGCWFHVDGAYGAFAGSLPELGGRYRGIERADSVAADPHKWLYVPVEAGAVLVRDPWTLVSAFATRADYFALEEGSYIEGSVWLPDRTLQLSRGFRALKIWAVIQAIGMDGYRELWRNDIAVAREVTRLATANPKLEVLAESDLSIFCIRYLPEHGDVDAFNRRLLDRIHRDGRHFVTPVVLNGSYGLRGCVLNFRSTLGDARLFVETVLELGAELERE